MAQFWIHFLLIIGYIEGGPATNPLQIEPIALRDVNEAHSTGWEMSDLKSVQVSRWVALRYAQLQVKRFYNREDRDPSVEEIFRMYNGGPIGYKKPETIAYWRKVEKLMVGRPDDFFRPVAMFIIIGDEETRQY